MALHLTPEEHDADPPEGWIVRKNGRRWSLCNKDGNVLVTVDTKREAERLKVEGDLVELYNDEGCWFAGGTVRNWRPYVTGQIEWTSVHCL